MSVRVGSLHIYPIKSTAPTDLTTVEVEPWGLAGDRRWLVADGRGEPVTGREHHQLLAVKATLREGNAIQVTGPHAEPIDLAPADLPGPLTTVNVWDDEFKATDAGDEAATWFSELIGETVRLYYLDDPTRRPTNPEYSLDSDRVSFADGYPLLITTTASLRQLNEWVAAVAAERGESATHLVMRRFRPSLVVEQDVPFAEDGWTRLRIGDVELRRSKLCDRCVMTTIDPITLHSGKEPIRTLSRHRRWDGKVWFGLNVIPDSIGTISVGDPVEVLA